MRYAAVIGLGHTKKSFVVPALGEIGTPRAVEALAVPLGDSDSAVRAVAAQALSELRGQQSLGYLREALRKEEEPFLMDLMAKPIRKLAASPAKKAAPAERFSALDLDVEAPLLSRR